MKQLVLQSNKENISRAEELIYDICDEYHVNNGLGVIVMAVMQAVENAMDHGNHFDAVKKLTLSWGTSHGSLFFEVEDEGEGFDFSQYGELPLAENRGEGIFMMSTLADAVTYTEGGRKVRLEFSVEGIDQADQKNRCSVLENFFSSSLIHV